MTFTPLGGRSSGGQITSLILFMTIKAPAFAWELGERSERRNMDSRVHHHRGLLALDLTPPISVKYDIPDVAGYDGSGGPSLTWKLLDVDAESSHQPNSADRDQQFWRQSGLLVDICVRNRAGYQWWRPRRSDPRDGTRRVRRTAEAAARGQPGAHESQRSGHPLKRSTGSTTP